MANNKITIGAWTWDTELLLSKIKVLGPDDCWGWRGSTSPNANLFGARKHDKPQMSQASRFIWMTIHGEDVAELEVRHTCGNRFCTNPKHMYTQPNHLYYHRDGRPRGMPKPKPREPEIKTRRLIPVTEELFAQEPKQKQEPWWKI